MNINATFASLFLGTALVGTSLAGNSYAQEKTLYFSGFGGAYGTIFQEQIIPPFEKSHNIKIAYVAGNAEDTLAKLIARKGNQELDVVLINGPQMQQAVALDLCSEIKPGENYKNVNDDYKIQSHAVGVGTYATGIAYNEKVFAEKGWTAPTSWLDFADPKFKNLIAMPPAHAPGYGVDALVMYARIHGGNEDNLEPGYSYVIDNIAPNIRVFESSTGRMAELLQSKEIVAAIWGSGRVLALANTGFPVKFVYPKEGAPLSLAMTCPITGSDVPEESQAFVDYLISPEVQKIIATEMGFAPANSAVELPDSYAEVIPYGEERLKDLVILDWNKIADKTEELARRWTREVERQ